MAEVPTCIFPRRDFFLLHFMYVKEYDVLIAGAGAAGMMAALTIVFTGRTVAIVEAKNRTGGRMHTINNPAFEKPVELGAEFVHGEPPITLELFKKAGIVKQEAGGEVWEYKNAGLERKADLSESYKALSRLCKSLSKDISVADFVNRYLTGNEHRELCISLKNYVEGYYAGNMEKASTYALRDDLRAGEDKDCRVDGGYIRLASYLERECRAQGVDLYLGEEVREINWQASQVELVTDKNRFQGKKVVITVSVGVLQSGTIQFSPALPQKFAAIKQLGFGHAIKLNFQFSDPFWKDKSITNGKDLSALHFLFSGEPIPTWWTQHPQKEALLVGWLGGPAAKGFTSAAKDAVAEKAIKSLAQQFRLDYNLLQQKIVGAEWYNWSADKHFCGAYSYNVINGSKLIKAISVPAENTVYFAGEGLHSGNGIGTVEAALASGRDVAHQLTTEL